MFGIENIAIFIGAGIMLNLYPGPDTLYIVGRSLSQGRAAGICAALGIGSGTIVHTLLGAFGLSAVLATSASAFVILKLAGAAYLIYQGIRMIYETASSSGTPIEQEASRVSLWRIYRQGALTNILNPKVALFFLAFLPQFISPSSSHIPFAFVLLGMIFVSTGTLWCLIVALFSSSLSRRMRRSEVLSRRLRRVNGLLFAALGLKLATAKFDL